MLVDTSGTALDGDSDGDAGGTFDFWFTPNSSANTIYVDKANAADPAQDGSIGHPYSEIDVALANVTAGTQAVRIVGNGGADGDVSTGADNLPYLIGRNDGNAVLQDGAGDRKKPHV